MVGLPNPKVALILLNLLAAVNAVVPDDARELLEWSM